MKKLRIASFPDKGVFMGRLDDKVAIITGAAKGIGLASAQRFIEEGAKVVMTDIDDANGQAEAEKLGDSAFYIHHDVAKEDEWLHVFAQTRKKFGRVDVVMNNAGIATFEDIEQTTMESWHHLLSINLDGMMLGMKYGIENMKDHGGSIISLSSIEGLIGDPDLFAYNASKGAVRIMSKSAALDCARKGYNIRINTIHPGYIHTPMIDSHPEMLDHLVSLHPVKRLGEAVEVANMAVFLASDESSFSTGSEFVCDGGYTAQ